MFDHIDFIGRLKKTRLDNIAIYVLCSCDNQESIYTDTWRVQSVMHGATIV